MSRTLLILAATTALASAAAAQTTSSTAPEPRTRASLIEMLNQRFGQIDSDSDGALTAAELEASQERRAADIKARIARQADENFAKLDVDKNGSLTMEEYRAGAPSVSVNEEKVTEAVGTLDGDKDGKVSKDEFGRIALAAFDRLDANKDGTVTAEERQKAMANVGR